MFFVNITIEKFRVRRSLWQLHMTMEAISLAINPWVLFAVAFAFLWCILYRWQKPVNYPPGPWGLPIVGNLPHLGSSPHIALTKLSKVYGDVFSVRFGSRDAVVLNSGKVVREALLQRHRQFSNRPSLFMMNVLGVQKVSIAFGKYCPIQVQRKRCALRAIHETVFSDLDHFNKIVQDVFKDFATELSQKGAEIFQPSVQLKMVVSKIMFKFTFGEDPGDHSMSKELERIAVESPKFTESGAAGALVDFIPWLKPFLRKQIAVAEHSVEKLINFVHKVYATRKHLPTSDSCIALCIRKLLENLLKKYSGEPKMYSSTLNPEQSYPPPQSKLCTISEEEMTKLISADIFGAGLETISNALCWAMGFIVNNQEIQQDLHRELDRTVGRHRLPNIQDKPNMPLLQATVLEVLRISSVLPIALPHEISEDTTLGSYKIPRGTLVVVNLWAVNHDPRVFDNPHEFNPYRFLDENGALCEKKGRLQMSFSIGSRRCLGSTLAKAEIFLLLACLLHKYQFSSSTGSNIDLKGRFGFTWSPNPFDILTRIR